eukprot:CAMPEP_0171304614 /NCGR_PEP_ID=MMETSP0816-20121228/14356_1 /TAXON_ID=420281 /ORGANISM="Proboscia inermis, Strain CCAP1064/1" /LENGTH=140 /DNA_ID=CAMNT_0011784815 /DNA_START=125 /DNA_END=547 /DNA_ORIENTATION=-
MVTDASTGSAIEAGDPAATAFPTGTLIVDPTVNPTVVPTQVPTLTPTAIITDSPATVFNLPAIFIKNLLIEPPLNNAETKWSADLKFPLCNPDDGRIEGAAITIECDNGIPGEFFTVDTLDPSSKFGNAVTTLGRFTFDL